MSTPCRSETNGIAENAVRRVKGAADLVGQSGLFRKVMERSDGMLLLFVNNTRQINGLKVNV